MTAAPDVFLSYNREDQAVAKRFAEAFEVAGLSVWWDVTLRSGDAYDQVTEHALHNAKAVVVLWSPRSAESRWVRAEATIADQNQTLVPVTIEACRRPVMFELTQTADLSHWLGNADDRIWLALLDDVRCRAGCENPDTADAKLPPRLATADVGMPNVALLPIHSRAGEKDVESLAEDLTEEIARSLGQSFYCKVISAGSLAAWHGGNADVRVLRRELHARYAVAGRLQSSSAKVQLSVQLIETESARMLWSSRYSSELSDVEESLEPFAVSIASDLDQALSKIEIAQAQSKRPPCTAWEHVLRVQALMNYHAPGNAHREVEEARQAVAAAADYGLAHATLAQALSSRLQTDRLILGEPERRTMIREIHDAAQRALELDGHDPVILTRIASAYGQLGDPYSGLRLAQRAKILAPHSADTQFALGFAHFMLGHTGEAIEAFGQYDSVAQSDNSRMSGQTMLGICLFIEGRNEEAETAIDRALMVSPSFYLSLRWKAIIAARLGKEQSARAAVRLLREAEPGKAIEDFLDSPNHLPIEHPRKYEAIEILRRLLEEADESE
jgi:TolB-like protein/tetratricopeptide (TPR) repeat protein